MPNCPNARLTSCTHHSPLTVQVEDGHYFYALDAIFPQLLRESPYVTKNAEEADYFFVSGAT